MAARMVSLAKGPAEVAKERVEAQAPIPAVAHATVPEYPWGACISLEDEVLDRLGFGGALPRPGEMIHFCAVAKVTNASMNERIDAATGQPATCRRVELQITNMGVMGADPADEAAKASEDRRKRFYGGSEGDDDED